MIIEGSSSAVCVRSETAYDETTVPIIYHGLSLISQFIKSAYVIFQGRGVIPPGRSLNSTILKLRRHIGQLFALSTHGFKQLLCRI